jgi:chemotaxis protein MotA
MSMHVVIGLLGLAAVLAATVATEGAHTFNGFLHRPALLLLVLAPPFVALTSYRPEELWETLRAVLRAVRHSPSRARAELYEDLTRFAAEHKRGQPAEALSTAEGSDHPLFRQLAPLVVRQYAAGEIERTAGAAAYCLSSSLKRTEDVLTSLARVAPAMGLVGTTLGLIGLLRDLSNFTQLGPSMALALLCTLYGLVLANGLYQPLARMVHAHSLACAEDARLLTRSLALLAEGKPIADVRNLFEGPGADAAVRFEPGGAVG